MAAVKDLIARVLAKVLTYIPGPIMSFIRDHKDLVLIVLIGLFVLAAFEGYRLVRGCIYAGAGIGCAAVSYILVGKFVPAALLAKVPAQLQVKAIVAILCGIIAVLLVKFAYKIVVFFIGAAVGFVGGYFVVARLAAKFFNTLAFLNTKLAFFIIGGVFAILCALIFVVAFKHICMIGSGVGGMTVAAVLAGKLVMPTISLPLLLCVALAGVVGGILCTVYQYKVEERANEIIF